MYLRRLNLISFRNYSSAGLELAPGTVIILGDNGAGKSNFLEAVQYSLSGRSYRTCREAEMVKKGAPRFRLEAEIERNGSGGGAAFRRTVSFEPGAGVRIDTGGGPNWLEPGSILCFSSEDLQLIKGPPAVRRKFLDEAISRRHPAHHGLVLDYRKVLSQRNRFLQRAAAGLLPLADIAPWDRQLATLALAVHDARQSYCRLISPLFHDAYKELSGEREGPLLAYRSQISGLAEGDRETALLRAMAEAWQQDMMRLSTSIGTHRDDMDFDLSGRSLKSYGSQGEQRTAVLAILLAGRRLPVACGGHQPLLLLDDVMSELDPKRRRRLMQALGSRQGYQETTGLSIIGQTIITAADRELFTGEELKAAAVIEVRDGAVAAMKPEAG
ncbi:MAG: DNA replication and repair protein RecF [Thermoleophilia bacterium]|nr:DNA replication and repair protein RecF [Thermoleophilia bacterium]